MKPDLCISVTDLEKLSVNSDDIIVRESGWDGRWPAQAPALLWSPLCSHPERWELPTLTGPAPCPAVGSISVASPEQPLLLAELAPKKDAEEITGWDAG